MRRVARILIAGAIFAAIAPSNANAQAAPTVPAGPRYVVTYLEVMPSATQEGAALVREMRDAQRAEPGNLRAEVVQRLGRTNQFVLLAAWADDGALEAHAKAERTAQLREKLKAIENAPPDERITFPLAVGPLTAAFGADAVLVVTHVDVIPPQRELATVLVKALAEYGSREQGNLRFEALTQTNRQNHFTVIEAWKSREAQSAHSMNVATRAFREKLAPAAGALYDDRLYRALD